jgi:hypothetical protein
MNERLDIDFTRIGRKWVCLFDLLGFSELLKQSIVNAFYHWELCLWDLKNWSDRYPDLEYAYFSDTFLIYAADDSAKSFRHIESASRWFFQIALRRNIPLRGAMACEEFYADKPKAIFLGKALVEAAKAEQKYNWIGFVLCNSVVERMNEIGIPADQRLNYRKWSVPARSDKANGKSEEVFALLFGASYPTNGQNTLIQELEKMVEHETEVTVREKYENSLKFLNHFGVSKIIPPPPINS